MDNEKTIQPLAQTVDEQLRLMEAETERALASTPMGQEVRRMKFICGIGKMFSRSDLVPVQYRGNEANCILAVDTALRMHMPPLAVMQNLGMINGMPGWYSKFLIATVNTCGRYQTLRYECNGLEGDAYGWRAVTYERGDVNHENRLEGPWVTWSLVKAEGWHERKGSKWKTMPEIMFRYRAAAFWQRTYAPELSMGMMTTEEAEDCEPAVDVVATEVRGRGGVRSSLIERAEQRAEQEDEAMRAAGTSVDNLFVDTQTGEVYD